jgi:hypothetical protein
MNWDWDEHNEHQENKIKSVFFSSLLDSFLNIYMCVFGVAPLTLAQVEKSMVGKEEK